jgi:hypothetical protein
MMLLFDWFAARRGQPGFDDMNAVSEADLIATSQTCEVGARLRSPGSSSLGTVAQPDPSAAAGAGCALVNELDSGSFKRDHDLCQTFDHTTDDTITGLHALNGRKRYPGCLG